MSISRTNIDFETMYLGDSSSIRWVRFTNTGSEQVTVKISPASTFPFWVHSNFCRRKVLDPGEYCRIGFGVFPQARGVTTVVVPVSARVGGITETWDVTLSVTAISPLAVSPSPAVRFGAVGVGTSRTKTATVTNLSDSEVYFHHAGDKPPAKEEFGVAECGGDSIAPGASCTYTVTFTPSQIGAVQDRVKFGFCLDLGCEASDVVIWRLRGTGT